MRLDAGGVVAIDERSPTHLRWVDWTIVSTRKGTVDRASGRLLLELERRLFFGLTPLSAVHQLLHDFERTEIGARQHTRTYEDEDAIRPEDREWTEVVGVTHTVYLVDRRGRRLSVADVSRGRDTAGETFSNKLRRLLDVAIAAAGPPPDDEPPRRSRQGKKKPRR